MVKYLYKMLKIVLGIVPPPAPTVTRGRVCLLPESSLLSITLSVRLQAQEGQNITRLDFSFMTPTNTHLMYTPVQPFVTPTC